MLYLNKSGNKIEIEREIRVHRDIGGPVYTVILLIPIEGEDMRDKVYFVEYEKSRALARAKQFVRNKVD